MKKLFTSEIKRKISEYRPEVAGKAFLDNCRDLLLRYETIFEQQAKTHPVFSHGWKSNFMSNHRFMNRVVMQLFEDHFLPNAIVLDIGCYDGMLPAVLQKNRIEAFGFDHRGWPEIWEPLGIDDINSTHSGSVGTEVPIGIAVCLNYAHNWKPSEIVDVVAGICGNEPDIILMDRDRINLHKNNVLWNDSREISSRRIDVVCLPLFNTDRLSDRDLLIWEK